MRKKIKTLSQASRSKTPALSPSGTILAPHPPFAGGMAPTKRGTLPSFGLALMVGAMLVFGLYLIYNHRTLNHTLAGFAVWAAAISISLVGFPLVPGAGFFSALPVLETKGSREWGLWKITLVGGGALAALGLSNYFLGQARGIFLLLSLLALGGFLALIDRRHHRAVGDLSIEPAPAQRVSFPWATAIILLFGASFLFFGSKSFIRGYDADSLKSLELADACVAGYTTPYVDAWGKGNVLFPYFLMGMFFKVAGCTFQKGVLFTALFNLAGYLFFYGFVRFYLPKAPALAATLLFIASHWVLYPALEIPGARGMLIPFECAALYFFARALEKGRPRDFALFGTFLAFSLMSAIQNWILLVLFTLALLTFWAWRPSALKSQGKSWVFAFLVAFLWYLPMVFHDKTYSCYWIPVETFSHDIVSQGPKFFGLWQNFFKVLQMFNIGSPEYIMSLFPFLSPWEGFFFLAGLGWCLRYFFRPSALLLLLGLLGGLSPSVLTDTNATLRCLAAAPFVFLMVGLGLDRLTMVLTAPLGQRRETLRFLLGAAFLALAVGWQYDIFFNRLPQFREAYWSSNGRIHLFGTISAKHLEGWDTYVDLGDGTWEHPENDWFYSRTDMAKGRRIIFRPDLSPLPLKNIPNKGALILLPDPMGKAFKDWISYYYPGVPERDILNPFGDVEYRLWEINPSQIRAALQRPEPREGVTLSWFDAKNRKLGQWRIPTLSADLLNQEWFAPCPGKPAFPWEKTSYFVVQGSLNAPAGKTFALEANGKVDGIMGNQKIHFDGRDPLKRVEIPFNSKYPGGFNFRYSPPKTGGFHLDLSEKTPLGRDLIPPSELKPQEKNPIP